MKYKPIYERWGITGQLRLFDAVALLIFCLWVVISLLGLILMPFGIIPPQYVILGILGPILLIGIAGCLLLLALLVLGVLGVIPTDFDKFREEEIE